MQPYAAEVSLLQEIPGVDWTLAAVIIAELGIDMTVFQSVSQLASWARVCPGNNESAGKRKSARIPKGNVYLKTDITFLFGDKDKDKDSGVHTTFVYSKGTDTWSWLIDNEDSGKRTSFAKVKLTRK